MNHRERLQVCWVSKALTYFFSNFACAAVLQQYSRKVRHNRKLKALSKRNWGCRRQSYTERSCNESYTHDIGRGVFFFSGFFLFTCDVAKMRRKKRRYMIKLEGTQRKAGRMLSGTEVHIWKGKKNGDRLVLGSGVIEIIKKDKCC